MNNDFYNKIIEIDGRRYRYDPDFDAYYRIQDQVPETLKQRLVKIAVGVALLVALLYFYGDPWFFTNLGEKL